MEHSSVFTSVHMIFPPLRYTSYTEFTIEKKFNF